MYLSSSALWYEHLPFHRMLYEMRTYISIERIMIWERTFSSSALWCSNNDLSALRTSTSLETPAGDDAWRLTTVIRSDRSWRETRHSRCSSSNWKHERKHLIRFFILVLAVHWIFPLIVCSLIFKQSKLKSISLIMVINDMYTTRTLNISLIMVIDDMYTTYKDS